MASFNTAHHESGGVILFNGELILLFCENVNLSVVERNENETGKLYLTTHRMIFTNQSMTRNLKSLSIPFFTMHNLSLEQPIFGANYIKGKANDASNNSEFTFKLKFTSGGATEYGRALLNAAKSVRNMAQAGGFQPPPPYTNPASQYYQAPPNVYQPAYNCGFALPNDIFNQPPPAGFIYTSEAPPPYPGLGTGGGSNIPPKPGYPPNQHQTGPYGQQPPYAPPSNQNGPPPPMGFGFGPNPGQGGFPQQPSQYGNPPQHGGGYGPPPYPGQQNSNSYPSQPPTNQYPGTTNSQTQQSSNLYPSLNDMPSAPPAP